MEMFRCRGGAEEVRSADVQRCRYRGGDVLRFRIGDCAGAEQVQMCKCAKVQRCTAGADMQRCRYAGTEVLRC